MNDELPGERSGFARSDAALNPAALDAALASAGVESEDARGFLREQKRLTGLQAKILHEEHALEISHLRWRRFNDQMKGALQIMAVALGLAVVIAIAFAVWSASQADGIVVESFSVPTGFAAAGLNGDVMAGDVTSRLDQIRRFVEAHSIGVTSDIRSSSRDDVHIEIPETGISLMALWRDMRGWLGHERHVTGSVRNVDGGRIALVVTLAGSDSIAVTSDAAHPGTLENGAAEGLFSQIEPIQYVVYLKYKGRHAEALAAARRMANAGNAVAFGLIGTEIPFVVGDFAQGAAYERLAISLEPAIQIFRYGLVLNDIALGHSEEELQTARAIGALSESAQSPMRETHAAFEGLHRFGERIVALLTGDYASSAIVSCFGACTAGEQFLLDARVAGLLHDTRSGTRLLGLARVAADGDPFDDSRAAWSVAVANADWHGAKAAALELQHETAAGSVKLPSLYLKTEEGTQVTSRLALADAHLGNLADAREEIAATPRDCYDCLRVRGEVEALGRNANGAATWFADAVKRAPSIPFAYADWGEMLLHKGDYGGAIAKFRDANLKGPHFADPLEMWGEALMQANRSDLALAKFQDSNTYAPNWGRLHLEWGKALLYLGRGDEARQQFAIASHLDLSASDAAVLAAWTARHV